MNPNIIKKQLELTQSIAVGDVNRVKTLIEQIKPHPIPLHNLHLAAHVGDIDVVRLLVQDGRVDPDQKWRVIIEFAVPRQFRNIFVNTNHVYAGTTKHIDSLYEGIFVLG